MSETQKIEDLKARLNGLPRFALAQLPTPIQPLKNFGALLNGPSLWMNRDDLTGLVGGGNKTRKLEYIVGDALNKGEGPYNLIIHDKPHPQLPKRD